MKRLSKVDDLLCKSFQGELISATPFWVAAVAEAFQLALLRWTQTLGPASKVGLFQCLISQAPAERSP